MILGLMLAASFIVVCAKTIGMKRTLGCHIPIDVLFTLTVTTMLSGTLGGLTAAIAGGLILSLTLWGLRKVYAYEAPSFDPKTMRITWTEVDPRREA